MYFVPYLALFVLTFATVATNRARESAKASARPRPRSTGTQLLQGQRFLRWRRAWRKNRSVRPLVAIVLKLEAIDDAPPSPIRRRQTKKRNCPAESRWCGASRGCSEAGAATRGLFINTVRTHRFQARELASTLDERGWPSSGPTEVWLHGHDLGGKAREITRAKKLYGLARYHSRIGSVASMRGMKCRHLSRRRLASWDLGKVGFTPAPVFSRLRSS